MAVLPSAGLQQRRDRRRATRRAPPMGGGVIQEGTSSGKFSPSVFLPLSPAALASPRLGFNSLLHEGHDTIAAICVDL